MNEQADFASNVQRPTGDDPVDSLDTGERDDGALSAARLWAVAGFVIGLAILAFVLLLERHHLEAEASFRFAETAQRTLKLIESRLDTSALLLRALQSAFLADAIDTEEKYLRFHENLRAAERLPSAVAICQPRLNPTKDPS